MKSALPENSKRIRRPSDTPSTTVQDAGIVHHHSHVLVCCNFVIEFEIISAEAVREIYALATTGPLALSIALIKRRRSAQNARMATKLKGVRLIRLPNAKTPLMIICKIAFAYSTSRFLFKSVV
jgi:hypothetical protein